MASNFVSRNITKIFIALWNWCSNTIFMTKLVERAWINMNLYWLYKIWSFKYLTIFPKVMSKWNITVHVTVTKVVSTLHCNDWRADEQEVSFWGTSCPNYSYTIKLWKNIFLSQLTKFNIVMSFLMKLSESKNKLFYQYTSESLKINCFFLYAKWYSIKNFKWLILLNMRWFKMCLWL